MGSPVSAIVANLYMEFFEKIAIDSSPIKPRVWLRYVDDTFCVLRKGTETQLLDHLNGVRPEIQFTMESEKDGKLPFLDCNVTRQENGELTVSVYRKVTHTDRYLNFNSHNPVHVRRGVVKCLYNRAENLVTMEEDLQREKEHLQKVLGWNGYPKSFISSSTKHHSNNKNQESHTDEIKVFIPYVQGMSEDIRRVCRQHGIKTIFKSAPTYFKIKVKYQLPIDKHSGIVYEIPCTCGKVYVGETIRRLGTRIKEHKEACQSCSLDKSAIAEHAWTEHHPIKWDNVKILDNANRQDLLRLKEAMHIQLKDEGERVNRDIGTAVPYCWIAMLKLL